MTSNANAILSEAAQLRDYVLAARQSYHLFVGLVHRPDYVPSAFSRLVSRAIDKFLIDVKAGKRPMLMLCAPPQFGKSALTSRHLAPYIFGHMPKARIAGACYAQPLARGFSRAVKAVMESPEYAAVFPQASRKGFRGTTDTADYFDVPGGGYYFGVGVGGPATGRSVDVAILDDLTKNMEEGLSLTVQDGIEAWFNTVLLTRMSLKSGIIVIGTCWSQLDILARIKAKFSGRPSYTELLFPALNEPDELGFDPALPRGSLVPELHDEHQLRDIKATLSENEWSALYQQQPLSVSGAIFKRDYVQYYKRAELPTYYTRKIISLDCAFKGNESSDFTCATVWGLDDQGRAWLLDWRREKIDFVKTARSTCDLRDAHPDVSKVYVEDAANGSAIISMLKHEISCIEGVPPVGSKQARAFAVQWVWETRKVLLPHSDEAPGISACVNELTSFPDVRNDDFVDSCTQAWQKLFVRRNWLTDRSITDNMSYI